MTLRKSRTRHEIVRGRFRLGWWVHAYVTGPYRPDGDEEPLTSLWFPTRRAARAFASKLQP